MKYILLLLLCFPFSLNAQTETDEASDADKPREEQRAYVRDELFLHARIHSESGYKLGDCIRIAEEERLTTVAREITSSINPEWTFLGPKPGNLTGYGNVGGRVRAIAASSDGNTVLIGPAGGGVWRSVDHGTTFTPTGDAFASLSMGAIAVAPSNNNIVYAGSGEMNFNFAFDQVDGGGLYRSTDRGLSWTLAGETAVRAYSDIIIHPTNPNIIFTGTSSGVRRSTDGGATFTAVQPGIIHSLVIDPNNPSVLYCAPQKKSLFKTIDGGTTWSALKNGLPPDSSLARAELAISTSNSNILYCSIYFTSDSGKIFKTTNGGTNWFQVSAPLSDCGVGNQYGQAWYDHTIAVDPTNEQNVYVGLIDLFRSTDGGSSWINLSKVYCAGTETHPDQQVLLFDPSLASTFFLGNDGGFYKSTDGGVSIINLNGSLGAMQFYRIASDQNSATGIMGGLQDNGTEHLFTGTTFAPCIGGDGFQPYFDPSNSAIVYAEQQFGKLFRSINGVGGTWSEITSGLPNTNLGGAAEFFRHYVIDPSAPATLYWASKDIYKTTNHGDDWTKISVASFPADVGAFAIAPSATMLYAALYTSSRPELYQSTSGGINWTRMLGVGLPNAVIANITVSTTNDALVYVVFGSSGASAKNVWQSTDGGTTFTNVSGNLPGYPVNVLLLHPLDEPATWIAGTDFGAYITQTAGASWSKLSNGLPNVAVFDINYYARGNKIRLGTHGRGIWEADAMLSDVRDERLASASPLGMNYPNPVHQATTIPVDGEVRGVIRICDIFGREIKAITVDRVTGVTVDLGSSPNGLYYYTLETPKGVSIRAMLLCK